MLDAMTAQMDSARYANVGETATLYSSEAFRTILARQPEWRVRAALEEGNIPHSHRKDALEWLEEQSRAALHQ